MKRMWKWFSKVAYCALLMAVLIACSPPVADKRDFAEALLLSESGRTIRGSMIGDNPQEVRDREGLALELDSDTLLVFDGEVHYDGRPVRTTVYYSFDDFGLFEIQFDLFPRSPGDASKVFRALKAKLTLIYGRAIQLTPKTMRFSTFSPSNNVVELTLSDETDESGMPFISFNIIEPLDDEI